MKTKYFALFMVLIFFCGCAEEKTGGKDITLNSTITTPTPAETTTTEPTTTMTTAAITTTTEATTTTVETTNTVIETTTTITDNASTTTAAPTTTTIAPAPAQTTNPICRVLWYYDNDNKKCQRMEFCGDYEYSGLKTFDSMYECLTGEEFDPGEELTSSPD